MSTHTLWVRGFEIEIGWCAGDEMYDYEITTVSLTDPEGYERAKSFDDDGVSVCVRYYAGDAYRHCRIEHIDREDIDNALAASKKKEGD